MPTNQLCRCLLRVGENATNSGFKPPLQKAAALKDVEFTEEELEMANKIVATVVPPPPVCSSTPIALATLCSSRGS